MSTLITVHKVVDDNDNGGTKTTRLGRRLNFCWPLGVKRRGSSQSVECQIKDARVQYCSCCRTAPVPRLEKYKAGGILHIRWGTEHQVARGVLTKFRGCTLLSPLSPTLKAMWGTQYGSGWESFKAYPPLSQFSLTSPLLLVLPVPSVPLPNSSSRPMQHSQSIIAHRELKAFLLRSKQKASPAPVIFT